MARKTSRQQILNAAVDHGFRICEHRTGISIRRISPSGVSLDDFLMFVAFVADGSRISWAEASEKVFADGTRTIANANVLAQVLDVLNNGKV